MFQQLLLLKTIIGHLNENLMYHIQVTKGDVKKFVGNFGVPMEYTTPKDAEDDLQMLNAHNEKLKVWNSITIVPKP